MDIIVLLPQGHCTKIQELQMTTVLEENVHVFGGECWDRASRARWSGDTGWGRTGSDLWPSFPLLSLPPSLP